MSSASNFHAGRQQVAALLGLIALVTLFSDPAAAQSIDETINSAVAAVTTPFVNFIFSKFPGTDFPWIVLWLIVAASVFTLYFSFVQIRCFGLAISLVKGDYSKKEDAGEVSHFQALSTALSGTVGLGNIAGVTVALSIGGPGATFWMILAGFLGMASKFCECTLGVKYRNEYPDGTVSGGPMYYLSKGLALKGYAGAGRIMAVIFAVFCVLGAFGGGNMFQANQVHAQLVNVTGGADSFLSGRGWLTGLVIAAIVFAVIVGGIKSIARFAEKIVPLMAVIYCGAALVIILMDIDRLPWAMGQIIQGAFTEMGVAGGVVGALIQGFRRAAFSNEAGVGSASIAHSAVRTNEPVTEGFVSLLEPFIDTVIICTMTALVIIITGVLQVDPNTGLYIWDASAGKIATPEGLAGVALTSYAFASVFSWFPYVLAVAVILFAFSTMISWSYYGVKAWTYLFGEGRTNEIVFNTIFCVFVVIGSAMNLSAVIDFADAAIFAMALINIAGLYILMPVVKEEMNSFLARHKSGEIRKTRA
ncbi:MAG: alanine/glycine:cation symporter family protein [Hyphomicrobium sp.]